MLLYNGRGTGDSQAVLVIQGRIFYLYGDVALTQIGQGQIFVGNGLLGFAACNQRFECVSHDNLLLSSAKAYHRFLENKADLCNCPYSPSTPRMRAQLQARRWGSRAW